MTFSLLFFLMFAGGWLLGRLAEKIRLPGVLGMTVWGVALGAFTRFYGQEWPAGFWEMVPFLKSLALVIILLRAGLGISRKELREAGVSAVLMTFVPCILEGTALTGLFMALFGWGWEVAGLTGFMLAAVSPAVVVPSMLDLKARGLGVKNGVITIVLAGASADDVFAISFFSIFLTLATNGGTGVWETLVSLPLTLLGGLGLGLGLGFLLAWWFKKRHGSLRATEKALLLLASSVFLVQVGEWLHAAALLGVMALGLILLERAQTVAHEVASKLGKIWIFAQIALFVVIGLSLQPETALTAGPKALLALAIGLVARSVGVLISTAWSPLSGKEKLFCVIAYLPKATVQAALGGVALAAGLAEGQTILAIAVLAIVVTAPLGLLGIRMGAKRLLN